jgi:hypothetical protein
MKLLIKRLWKKSTFCSGKLFINDKEFCFTIEDVDRGLSNNMTLSHIGKIKKYGITAIPTGTYQLVHSYSNRFKRLMPEVVGVKGFAGIRIHVANTAKDVEGCIGLAYEDSSDGFAGNSKKACDDFEKLFIEAIKTQKVWITIE